MSNHEDTISRRVLNRESNRRRDAVTAGLGALLVGGVFTDGWAHFNRPGMESFFTPWHAALYSSLGVMTVWLLVVAYRASEGRLQGTQVRIPRGYGLALVGAAIFGAAGMADMVWHQLFGIEVAIDALLSPTHLALGAGGILILSTAMRAQQLLDPSSEGRWTAAARASLTLTLAVVVFFLLYLSPFTDPQPVRNFIPTAEGSPGHRAAELPVIAAMGSYLLITVVIALPLLLMSRNRGFPPRGGAVLTVVTVALLPVMVVDLPRTPLMGALGAIVGAVVFETSAPLVARRLTARQASWAMPAALAALVWIGHLAGLALATPLGWPVSLWSGLIVLSTLLAAAVGFLVPPQLAVVGHLPG